jgi:hypothetical protein
VFSLSFPLSALFIIIIIIEARFGLTGLKFSRRRHRFLKFRPTAFLTLLEESRESIQPAIPWIVTLLSRSESEVVKSSGDL